VLTQDTVVRYLIARGIVPDGIDLRAESLTGGVSNDVFAVYGSGVDLVLKQALPKLRVEQEWLADPTRILVEADALRIAGQHNAQAVPAVVDVDVEALTLTVARAPRDWHNWKDDLLDGIIDVRVAAGLGSALARWHAETTNDTDIAGRFGKTHFDRLRIDPFYRVAAARNPELADRINGYGDALLSGGECLVHGDFSPKNVLAGDGSVWVLDWEVAHYGHPVFDLAFLNTHLLLKASHQPRYADQYEACSHAFNTSYTGDRPESLVGQVGCLLLARLDGKSPAPYLDSDGRDRARALAIAALTGAQSLDELWKALR
jgi:5-methylthioribose kinase